MFEKSRHCVVLIPIAEPEFTKTAVDDPPSLRSDKGTSLEFTVCEARTLFRPHPQPLSHCVGEGCRGARRCALQRVPPLPQAGEGDKGGEGNTAHLLVHACAGKNSPCFKDFVPNRCTLTSCPLPPCQGGEGRGEGGFESCAFTNFGSAVGMTRRVRMCGSIGVRRSGSVFGWRIGARASATRARLAPKRQ